MPSLVDSTVCLTSAYLLQNNTLQFLDNTTYLLETITGVVSKHASTQLTSLVSNCSPVFNPPPWSLPSPTHIPPQTAQEVSAAVSTVKSILIFPVDLLRVNDLHKLDYFVDAAVVATLPPGRVSSVTLTYVSTLYRWRSASAGQQSVWELGTA